jgi:hypothetical protein
MIDMDKREKQLKEFIDKENKRLLIEMEILRRMNRTNWEVFIEDWSPIVIFIFSIFVVVIS